MIKKILMSFTLIIMLFSFNSVAFAEENAANIDISKIESFSKNLQENGEYIPEFNIKDLIEKYKETGEIGLTLKDTLSAFGKFLIKEIVGNSKLLVELLFLGILSAVLQSVHTAFSDNSIGKVAHYACFATIVIIIIKSFTLVVTLAQGTIDKMLEFTNILIPPLLMLIATTGGIAAATTLDPITMLLITISSTVIRNFVIPFTIFVVILNIVNSLSEESKVAKLASLLKQINLWVLGFLMTIFITLITIRSSAAATMDQVTLKTTKFFVDNFIPLVGKSLSDAVTTVVGYSLILKDALSIIGLVIMVCICVFPLLKIIIISLIYKFVGAVMEPVVDRKITNCLSTVGGSFTIIFASVLCVAVMFFIMITIITTTGRLILTVG